MQSELMKCSNPNSDLPMCRECQRSGESKDNEYEAFDLNKTLMNGYRCDGYVSKRETESLFSDMITLGYMEKASSPCEVKIVSYSEQAYKGL